MTEKIDHAAKALELSDHVINGATWQEIAAKLQVNQAGAQAHATLALVEQQRIANVLRLADMGDPQARSAAWDLHRDPQVSPWEATEHRRGLRPEIAAALGIGEES